MWRTLFIGSSVDNTFGTVTYAVIFLFRKYDNSPVRPGKQMARVYYFYYFYCFIASQVTLNQLKL